MRPAAALLDLLLPLRCAACGVPASRGWCPACAAQARLLVLPGGGHVHLAAGIEAVGLLAYTGVARRTLHGLKAGGRHAAAVPLGALLRQALLRLFRLHHIDQPPWALTWVPASATRRRQRGMDVPRLLAGPQAVPLLERVAERPDQTLLDAAQRRLSPAGSFAALRPVPAPVVLVDDVRTSGATALAAAGALRAVGAPWVLVVTLAVAGADAVRAAGSDAAEGATPPGRAVPRLSGRPARSGASDQCGGV